MIEHLGVAVRAAEMLGATDAVALRVGQRCAFADVFLIVTGDAHRQVQAIADAIERSLNEAGARTLGYEGREAGHWVLLNFGELIVHVFCAEERQFYGIERLWRDCPQIDLPALQRENHPQK